MQHVPVGRFHGLAVLVLSVGLTACAADDVPTGTSAADDRLQTVEVNGAELHYLARGEGPAIVFVHGGLADYQEWLPVMEQIEGRHATIAYSRRHSFPNRDNPVSPDHSPLTEADDLAALIRELGVAPAHVVGTSYGAFTALALALRHPGKVHSLSLVEPPLVSWLPAIEGGQAVYDEFQESLVTPVRAAFEAGDRDAAFAITISYFAGPDAMAHIPAEVLASLRSNLRDWEVMFRSTELLPDIRRETLRELQLPVLMLSGADSYELGQLIDAELEQVIPGVRRVLVPDGTHDACVEHPAFCAREISAFIEGLGS